MGRLRYKPGLDGIRGIAIASVVGYHLFHFPRGGFMGVTVFFVLSGYLITRLLLEEYAATGRINLRRFYVRRVRRLGPALAAFLIAVSAAVVINGENVQHRLLITATGIYATNIAFAFHLVYFGPGAVPPVSWISHLWSLAEEEQFYLLWPLLLAAFLVRRVRLHIWLSVLLVVSLAAEFFVSYSASAQQAHFAPYSKAAPLVAGCLLAARRLQIGRRVATIGAITLLVTMIFGSHLGLWLSPVVIAASASLIGYAAEADTSLLAWSPLVKLGLISYSLYLWHVFIGQLMGSIPALALSILAAAMSYRYIERPFRRRGSRPAPLASTAAPAPAAAANA
jgi:peptidoglycan/LPS O-acetylase OafA/YrhL